MRRASPWYAVVWLLCTAPALAGCDRDEPAVRAEAKSQGPEISDEERLEQEREAFLNEHFPKHGLVTGLQLKVRSEPDPEANVLGWLRIGSRVRLKAQEGTSATCSSGWYPLYPQGYVCAGEGVKVGDEPPESEFVVAPPEREAALPYQYWYVKEEMVPEYHRLPSRNEQRAAQAYADRYNALLEKSETKAAKFLAGELSNEVTSPAVVNRYLKRGFFVAGAGTEERARRIFVRTVRGRFVKQSRLIERTGHDMTGVELGDEHKLPLAFALRTAPIRFKKIDAEGVTRFPRDPEAKAIERQQIVTSWLRRENIEGRFVHVLDGDRYVLDWFIGVARKIDRPKEVAADEPWVHVDLSDQILVLYEGDTPKFTTLVSTGLDEFKTPTGLFTIEKKFIADTMSNLGGDMDDLYSIEDVPWTQYFAGGIALHAAFWHTQFGLQRSHGCVNLSPQDAHRIFDALWPHVPQGWLGVDTEHADFKTSHVWVTE